MNKLFKRTTAFVLMVCLLSALAVPAVLAAPAVPEADGSYVYDFACSDGYEFMADPGNDQPFVPRVFSPKSAYTKPDGTVVSAISAIPCTNKTGLALWAEEYEAGNFDFGYETTAADCKEQGAFQLQVVTVDDVKYTCILYKDGTAGDGKMGWGAIKIKAPAAGVYDVTLTHITQGSSGTNGSRNFLIPVSAVNAEAIGTDIAAIVASTDSKYELANTVNYSDGKQANVETELGTFVQDQPAEKEYYLVFTTNDDAKRCYLQSLKFTPSTASAEAKQVRYALTNPAGTISNEVALSTMATQYAANERDIAFVGYDAGLTKFDVSKTDSYIGYTIYGVATGGVVTQRWVAMKFRAPGTGDYTVTINTRAASTVKSGADFNVYMTEATNISGTDYAAAMTYANKLGTSALSVDALDADMGKQTFTAGKEYVLILQGAAYNKDTQANNFYLTGVSFVEVLPAVAAIGTTEYLTVAEAVAAAQAGDTIKLLADYVGSIDAAAGVSIDLNGNTWTVSEYVAAGANEYVIDSVGGGSLKAGSAVLYGANNEYLALAEDDGYSLAKYELTVDAQAETSPANAAATRFWFKLDLADADLDKIAAGETGLTIGVELDWGQDAPLVVTFDNGEGAEAFAAAWAAAYKAGNNVWLYADIKGLSGLESDLTVKPILKSAGSTLYNGTITYTVG